MRKFLSTFLIFAIVFQTQLSSLPQANAALTEADKALVGSEETLTNPGFESSTAAWSKTGGTLTTITGAGKDVGNASGSWDSNAAGQILATSYQTVAAGDGYSGKNGAVGCDFKCASGTCTHKLEAFDGTNLLASETITSSTTGYVRKNVNFIYPLSGTVRLQVKSVAADEPTLYVDKCTRRLAEGYNLSIQAPQARLYGTIKWPSDASCAWSYSSGSWGNFPVVAACATPTVTGALSVSTSSPNATPTFSMVGAPEGHYSIRARSGFTRASGTNSVAFFRFSDGVTPSNSQVVYEDSTAYLISPVITGDFTYTDSKDRTIDLQARTNGAGSTQIVTNPSGGDPGLYVEVYYYPSGSQQAVSVDNTAASWSGYQTHTTGWDQSSPTYAPPSSGAGVSTTTLRSRNLTCGSFGTAAGISCNLPAAGTYKVCATIAYSVGGDTYISSKLVDGTGNDINKGAGVRQTGATSVYNCGDYSAASSGVNSFQIYNASNTGVGVSMVDGIGAGSPELQWTVFQMDHSQGIPYYTGSVTSSTAGQEHIERVRMAGVCSSGSCVIADKTPGIASVTWVATGRYSVAFTAGTFSGTPTCVGSESQETNQSFSVHLRTTSGVEAATIYSATNTYADGQFGMICMGPH